MHEFHWTPTARHADIVLPAANPLEREDVAAGPGDARLRAMPRVVAPHGDAREEFWIYGRLAALLGVDLTDGMTSRQWLERVYEQWRERPDSPAAPPFGEFWAAGGTPLPQVAYDDGAFARFRADPRRHPLATPSGRIELFSATLDGFALPDVAGHAFWPAPAPAPGEFDLELLCTQPSHRLHSQLDMGAASRSTKVAGREPIRLHPADARARGLAAGDVVRVRSARGSILAGVVLTDALIRGVAQMHTGAWFDPSAPEVADCISGNVNVLTEDVGTSTLTQASNGARVRVAVEAFPGDAPPVRAYAPPTFAGA